MFSEDSREIFLLCLNNLGICYTHMWSIIYPFSVTYAHYVNNNNNYSKLYLTIFFFSLGGLLSSHIGAKLYQIAGISLGLMLVGSINMLSLKLLVE